MKKMFILYLILLMAVITFSAQKASAIAVAINEINDAYFNNVENWVDVDQDQQISQGDYFYGILHVQNIDGRLSGTVWNEDNVSPGFDTFTGYFLTDVASVTLDGGIQPHITLGPYTGGADPNAVMSAAELAAGVVLKMWTDSATKFTDTINLATDIANATDTLPWATFTTNGGYWYSHAPLTPPLGVNTVGETFMGLMLVSNFSGLNFALVDDPNESEINLAAHLVGQGEIEDEQNHWAFQSNDPVFFQPIAVPEPGTMSLIGFGLLGMAAFARWRRK